jgi:hypothetical protein
MMCEAMRIREAAAQEMENTLSADARAKTHRFDTTSVHPHDFCEDEYGNRIETAHP